MKTRHSHGLLQLGREPWLTVSKSYRANNALFVSVDLIGEKNQVMLELSLVSLLIGFNPVWFGILSPFSFDLDI